jgi:hypothetical protein
MLHLKKKPANRGGRIFTYTIRIRRVQTSRMAGQELRIGVGPRKPELMKPIADTPRWFKE